jgi:glycosyltransferase involved in cell wall biosynthesis
MMDSHGTSARIVPVPNAVDMDQFRPGDRAAAKRQLGASPHRPLLLMLANLAPHKGQETAIRAAAQLARHGRAVDLWLAGVERGGGQVYQTKLENMATQLDVADRMRFLGFRSDGPALLRAADFLLLPSTHEGLPLSILEAQASKVPVLAAPTAGVPDVVEDGKTGFLIDAADAAGYADRIADLLDSPELYGTVTDAAYRHVGTEHTWDAYTRRIWTLYEETLKGAEQSRLPASNRRAADQLEAVNLSS